jgi:hypothetical protein
MPIAILTTSILASLLIINGWWIPPSSLLFTLCFITGFSAFIHYLLTRSQPYIILVSLAILISDTFAAWAYRTWSEHGFGFSPLAMARGAFFLMLVITMYGVFAYWRAVTAFRMKRGNVEREKLVPQKATLQETLQRFFDLWRTDKSSNDIYLPLGEKVETRD